MVIDLNTGQGESLAYADNLKTTLDWYAWANDETILFGVGTTRHQRGVKYSVTRLQVMTLGKDDEPRNAIRLRNIQGSQLPQLADGVISLLPDEPDHILINLALDVANHPSVYKLDLNSGRVHRVLRAKSDIYTWVADRQGRIRIGLGRSDTEMFVRLYDEGGDNYRILWEYELFNAPEIDVLGFDLNPNILYLRAEHEGRYAVFRADVSQAEPEMTLFYSHPDYDIDGGLVYSPKTGKAVGIRHGIDGNGIDYWDSDYQMLQASLDETLPDHHNRILAETRGLRRYILFSSSESDPGHYYLGDRTTNAIDYIGSRYPQVNPTNHSGKEAVRYQARDGLELDAMLTRPMVQAEDGAVPAVILPHGGPAGSDKLSFDYWSALLANQGYVVLQPNFRGSSGRGFAFSNAAIAGWGAEMQDDLQDAAHYLVEQGLADPERICIVGASYGGYAALMAAVKHGDTFRCAVSFAGVSDLEKLVSDARHFSNEKVVRKQLGTDRKRNRANSPVRHAKQIETPILLIHGSDDDIVPVAHSRDMHKALQRQKKPVRYLELEYGDHHLWHEQHRLETMQAIVDFLDEHLKN
ncbi:S9 family peptidase [Ferrimonas pelagia]|uniref:S9 family peptidase n=2 Tax=Ferrimonas pelagia TaxID=1177826 RepID=A0ABP9ECR5_9GAMM